MDRPQAPTPDQDDTVPTGHGPALKVSALMILALAGALAVAAGHGPYGTLGAAEHPKPGTV